MSEHTTYSGFFRELRASTPSLVTVGNVPAPEAPRPKLKWNPTPLIGLATITHPGAILAILFGLVIVFMLIESVTGIKMGTLLAATSWLLLAWVVWPVLRWCLHSAVSRKIDTELYFHLLLAQPIRTAFSFSVVLYALTGGLWALFSKGPLTMGQAWPALAGSFVFGWLGLPWVMRFIGNRQQGVKDIPQAVFAPLSEGFGLYFGQATGVLRALGHGAGIREGEQVGLSLDAACENVKVFGGIGSGKTTRAIQPILVQLLDQECAGLIFDIKGDFKHAVRTIAAETGHEITLVGPGHAGLNLLEGLSPEAAASFLKSCLLLNGGGKGDSFWIDTATELCRNALGVLSFLDGRYSLHGLYQYLFEGSTRADWDAEALDVLGRLDARDQRLLRAYQAYHENIFSAFDDKVKAGVNASVAQILAPFTHPDLIDAFCTAGADMANMSEVENGKVYVVDMPLSRWGLGGKVAYTFIKLRFMAVVQNRSVAPDWNQRKASVRPLFFMCDEYQEIVSCAREGLSDLSFWDKSRSNKCIGVISSQSVSSFYAAIGDRALADTVLQNFRQTICFRTEDEATINRLNNLMGRVEIARYSYSQGEGTSSQMLAGTSQSENVSTQVSYQEKAVFNPQMFRQLGPNQAVCLLSIGGHAADDVLNLTPVFV